MRVLRPSQRLYSHGHSARIVQPRQVEAGGGAFSPGDLANLELWLEGTQDTYTDTAGTTATTTDGDDVKHWSDLSSNNNDATEGTNNPEWDSAPDMSDSSVYFDGGSNEFLTLDSTLDLTGDFTICIAYQPNDLSNSGILGKASNSGSFWHLQLLYQMQFRSETSAIVSRTHTVLAAGTDYVVTVTRSGSTCTLRLDGSSQGTFTMAGTFRVEEIGRILQNSGFAATAHFGMIVITSDEKTGTDLTDLEQYASDGWTGSI